MCKLSKGLTSLVVAFAAVATLATGGVLPAAAAEYSNANAEMGYPHFGGVDNPIPASGQAFNPSAGYLSKVFDNDLSRGRGQIPIMIFGLIGFSPEKATSRPARGPTMSEPTSTRVQIRISIYFRVVELHICVLMNHQYSGLEAR